MPRLTYQVALPALFFCLAHNITAQPDTVLIGAYVMDIYDIKMNENSFSAQFWVWFNYANKELIPLDSLEFPNEKESECSNQFKEESKGISWAGKRVNAVLKKEWDIRYFPFDAQKMTIEFEESNNDIETMVYVADSANTKLDPRLKLTNWEIERFEIVAGKRDFNTTFGDPELTNGRSTYAHADLNVYIKRKTLGLFFSLFTGMYVAFFISWLVFFIPPKFVDPRFGLSVGGLFAAVGNKYIVDSVLPQSTTFTLVDKLHIITYFFLLLCIVLSVISLRLWSLGKEYASARFDAWAWKIILLLYLVANLGLIWGASVAFSE